MSKSALDELKRKKPKFPMELVHKLAQVMEKLVVNERFEMLQGVRADQFLEVDQTDELRDLSLGALVEIGPVEICTAKAIGPARVRRFIDRLSALTSDSDNTEESPTSPAAKLELIKPGNGAPAGASPINRRAMVFNSVDAERRLKQAIQSLKNFSRFEEIKEERLERYWKQEYTRAPFIESLTIRQLTNLDIDSLLKKRSFGPGKLQALLDTIKDLVGKPAGVGANEGTAPAPQQTVADNQELVRLEWCRSDGTLPSFSAPLAAYCEQQIERAVGPGPLVSLLRTFPSVLSERDFALLWLAREYGIPEAANLFGEEAQACGVRIRRAGEKLRAELRIAAPELLGHWERLLASVAVPTEALIDPFRIGGISLEFQGVATEIAVLAMGATAPAAERVTLVGYWSLNPDGLQYVVDALRSGSATSDEELTAKARALAPYVEPNQIISLSKS